MSEQPSTSEDSLAHLTTLLAGEEPNEVREGLLVDFSLVTSLALVRAVSSVLPQGNAFAEELIHQWRARVQERMRRAFVDARKLERSVLGGMMIDQAESAFSDELRSVEQILRVALLAEPTDPPATGGAPEPNGLGVQEGSS